MLFRPVLVCLFLLAPLLCSAELLVRELRTTINGLPVEIFAIVDSGLPALTRWSSLPSTQAYPDAGMPLPELASRLGASTAINANFYREDIPQHQLPIGLVVHKGRMLSLPHRYYPTIGVIEGKLAWDNVRAQVHAILHQGAKSHRIAICRLEGSASAGCASLRMNKIPDGFKNRIHISADSKENSETGLLPGKNRFSVLQPKENAEPPGVWALELPAGHPALGKAPPEWVEIEVQLSGERHGGKWQSVTEAVSGSHALTPERIFPSVKREWAQARQPRSFAGVDRQGRGWIAVFDGRRETSSGIAIQAAWEFLRKNLDAAWAINLDGGGSSILLHDSKVLNKPSDGRPRAIPVGWGALSP